MEPIAPITREIHVKAAPERAFRFFTERMGEWWPFGSYSVYHGEKARFEAPTGKGARIVEHGPDGKSCAWGEVLVWEPPRRVIFNFGAWEPGKELTEVEVTFVPDGSGTRVRVEHRGWEKLGAEGRAAREGYLQGWPKVLDECYAGFVDAARAA